LVFQSLPDGCTTACLLSDDDARRPCFRHRVPTCWRKLVPPSAVLATGSGTDSEPMGAPRPHRVPPIPGDTAVWAPSVMRLGGSAVKKIHIAVFWIVTPCSLVARDQRCRPLSSWWRFYVCVPLPDYTVSWPRRSQYSICFVVVWVQPAAAAERCTRTWVRRC
jgi:hypothetical protein